MKGSVEFRMDSIFDFASFCSSDRGSRLLIAWAAASSSVMAIAWGCVCGFRGLMPSLSWNVYKPFAKMNVGPLLPYSLVVLYMSMSMSMFVKRSTWRMWALSKCSSLCH